VDKHFRFPLKFAIIKYMGNKGFTLVEILIYISILAIVGGLISGILLTITQVYQRESASDEVTSQLSFTMQTIQRLIRESSNIEINSGITTTTIKLRMADAAKDPTCIFLDNGVIKLAEGPASPESPNCTTDFSNLTSDKVVVNTLNFVKLVQPSGHDTVSIELTMSYNSQNPKSQVQRTLQSAIARVSAATFDSNLLPGSGSSYDFGYSATRWRNGFFSGDLTVDGGIILKSPDQSCHKIIVDNLGGLSTTGVSCP
jgi:type II secretory pathway pseudopilin PulG